MWHAMYNKHRSDLADWWYGVGRFISRRFGFAGSHGSVISAEKASDLYNATYQLWDL